MTDCFDNHDLRRFIDAQDGGTSTRRGITAFEAVIEELRNGQKVGHWIWFIFPQIEIGQSEMARKYAIKSLTEAEDYLKNQLLHDRLLLASEIVASQLERGVHPEILLGSSTDCLKLSSSITLFKETSNRLSCISILGICTNILDHLLSHSISSCNQTKQWFNAERDAYPG